MNEDFVGEFGEELFDEIFSVIYGDTTSNNIQITSCRFTNPINRYGEGVFTTESGETIHFQFKDGDGNGSEITDYGEIIEPIKHYVTVRSFELDEERIIAEGHEERLPLMGQKFQALKDTITEKERKYNYDMRFSPSNAIAKHYEDWCRKHYIKIVCRQVETD